MNKSRIALASTLILLISVLTGVIGNTSAQAGALEPTITYVTPPTGSISGGTKITIVGENFAGSVSVSIEETPCTSVRLISSTQITCITPSGTPGAATTVVTNGNGDHSDPGFTGFYYVDGPMTLAFDKTEIAMGEEANLSFSNLGPANAGSFWYDGYLVQLFPAFYLPEATRWPWNDLGGCGRLPVTLKIYNKNYFELDYENPPNFSDDSEVTASLTFLAHTTNCQSDKITFNPLPDVELGQTPPSLQASTDGGANVFFKSTTPKTCTVFNGDNIKLLTKGTCTILAHTFGNSDYFPAPDVTRSFNKTVDEDYSRLAAAAAAAQRQRELTELFSIIPAIAGLALNLADLSNTLLEKQKCVKGKKTKYVTFGSKCPKGYKKK